MPGLTNIEFQRQKKKAGCDGVLLSGHHAIIAGLFSSVCPEVKS